ARHPGRGSRPRHRPVDQRYVRPRGEREVRDALGGGPAVRLGTRVKARLVECIEQPPDARRRGRELIRNDAELGVHHGSTWTTKPAVVTPTRRSVSAATHVSAAASASGGWVVATAMTRIPAAFPAATPGGESSMTT